METELTNEIVIFSCKRIGNTHMIFHIQFYDRERLLDQQKLQRKMTSVELAANCQTPRVQDVH